MDNTQKVSLNSNVSMEYTPSKLTPNEPQEEVSSEVNLSSAVIICKNCGKESPVGKRKAKIFCSRECQSRFASKQTWERKKNIPGFKEMKYKNLTKWISRNRDHFNDLVREPNKLRSRKRYLQYKAAGLCRKCGGEIEDKKYFNCAKCRKLWETYRAKNKK